MNGEFVLAASKACKFGPPHSGIRTALWRVERTTTCHGVQ
jgi:hypothetical protein